MQDHQAAATTTTTTTSSPPSSSERSSSSSALRTTEESKEGMDSDEDIGRVPELGVDQSTSGSRERAAAGATSSSNAAQGATTSGRRRGQSPADKEHRRLKRLLRNRVSAQQARERKKAYMGELEARVKDLEKSNLELDERVATLQNENQMLRQILKNTTANRRAPGGGSGSGSAGVGGDGK